jgi:sec-independent protein translocase protein TatA
MGLPNIGPLELIIILAIALLIVGPGRLPEMGNAIGRTIREFRKASTDMTEAATIETEPKPATPVAPAATAAPVADAPATAVAAEAVAPVGEAASVPPQPNTLSGAATPNTTTQTPLPATPSEPKADGNDNA